MLKVKAEGGIAQMKEVVLNEEVSILYANTELPLDNKDILIDLVTSIKPTIDNDKKLRKQYGVGTFFQLIGVNWDSEIVSAVVNSEGDFEINDILLNREVQSLSQLKEVISDCKYETIVFTLKYDGKLFVVFVNDCSQIETDGITYNLMAIIISDD